MKNIISRILVFILIFFFAATLSANPVNSDTGKAEIVNTAHDISESFIENVGQSQHADVRFYAGTFGNSESNPISTNSTSTLVTETSTSKIKEKNNHVTYSDELDSKNVANSYVKSSTIEQAVKKNGSYHLESSEEAIPINEQIEESFSTVPIVDRHRSLITRGAKEIKGARSKYARYYKLNDGRKAAIISSTPIQYKNLEGSYQLIDNTLVADENQDSYAFRNASNLFTIHFPEHSDSNTDILATGPKGVDIRLWSNGKIWHQTEEGEYEFLYEADLSTGITESDKIKYENRYPFISEIFTIKYEGVKHNYLISEFPSFLENLDSGIVEFREVVTLPQSYKLSVDGIIQSKDFVTDRDIYVVDERGDVVCIFPAPWAHEGTDRTFEPEVDTELKLTYRVAYLDEGKFQIAVRVPLSWLTQPDRTYPVTIDPSLYYYETHSYDDCYSWGSTLFNYSAEYMKVGYTSGYGVPYYLAYMTWHDVTIPAGSTIDYVEFWWKAYDNYSNTCSFKWQFEDADNAKQCAYEYPAGRDYVNHYNYLSSYNIGWTSGSWYGVNDFSAGLQDVIDRSGWSSGNNVGMKWCAYSASGGDRYIYSYDYSSGSAPYLYVEYTVSSLPDLLDRGEAYRNFSPTTIDPTGALNISFDVCNEGSAGTGGGYRVVFVASTDQNIEITDYLIGSVWMGSLDAGACDNCDFSGVPASSIPDGTYWVGWIIDEGSGIGNVNESNEENNTAYKTGYQLTVSGAKPIIRISPTSLSFTQESSASTTCAGDPTVQTETISNGLVIRSLFTATQLKFETNGSCQQVFLEGGVLPEDEPGTPWLPAKYVNVLIPAGAKVASIKTSADEVLIAEGIDVCPVQPPVPTGKPAPAPTDKNAAAYAIQTKVPAKLAEVTGHHTMRGFTYVSIRLNPVRYIPARQELYLAENLNVKIEFEVQREPVIAPATNNGIFKSMIRKIVVNGDMLDTEDFTPRMLDEIPTEAVDYLIITSSALQSTLQTLADHRASHNGFSTSVLTLESIYQNPSYNGDDNQEEIRNCIEDYVNNKSTAYVVLGGDDTVVPDRDCHVTCSVYTENNMPTDLYYAGLDSSWDEDGDGVYGEADTSSGDEGDLAPDVFVGRIPVRTSSQVTAYVNKVVAFENNPPMALLSMMLLLGDHLGGSISVDPYDPYTGSNRPSDSMSDGLLGFLQHSPVSDSEMWSRRLYRDAIAPYWQPGTLSMFFDTITSWDGSTPGDYLQNGSNVSSALNQGWYHVFMETHGNSSCWELESGSFCAYDASSLNGHQYIVYTGACSTGYFDGGTDPCLSEAFLRNANGGAIAYFGCSRYGWFSPDRPPASDSSRGGTSMEFAYDFYEEVLGGNPNSLGEGFYLHKAAHAGQSGSNGSNRWIQFGLNFQGDPAIGAEGSGSENSFTIYNDGTGTLEVSSMSKRDGDPWLSWAPTALLTIPPGGSQAITVSVDWGQVSGSSDDEQIIVYSNDDDMRPYPNAVFVNATKATVVPTVTTTAVSSITSNSAFSGGNVTSNGGASVTARGVCWSTSANPTTTDSHTSDGTGTGSFTSSITGLSPNTTYHVRAYATNSVGTGYGSDQTFITLANAPGTASFSNITQTSIQANWTANGNPAGTQYYCENTTAVTNSGCTTNTYWNSTGLTGGTSYTFRVKARNGNGTQTGWTNLGSQSTQPCLTTPTVTTTAVSSITSNSASSGGNVTNDGGASVTARGVCWSTSANPTTSDSHTTDGTGTGSFTSSITGLSLNITYHVRAYATNSVGTGYGSDQAFITLANAPGTSSFSNITQTSIQANWTANGNPAGTQYYCENTTAGANSGWTTNTYWDCTGLTCGTSYSFRVKARNGDDVETGSTELGSQSTQGCSGDNCYVNKDDLTCGGNSPCYSNIQKAIDAAGSVCTIRVAQGFYDEDVTLNTSKILALQGGWDSTFTTQPSNTTINSLTISSGTIVPSNIILQAVGATSSSSLCFYEDFLDRHPEPGTIENVILDFIAENIDTNGDGSYKDFISDSGHTESVRNLITHFYETILGREPESWAVEAWEHGYFNHSFFIDRDVHYVAREMGLLFFLSEEYELRNRSNAEFIDDCSQAFLNQSLNEIEQEDWICSAMEREEVVASFANSDGFAKYIDSLFH